MADKDVREAIAALQGFEPSVNTATRTYIDAVILAAQSTLSSATMTATSFLVWSSFKAATQWQPQVTQFFSQADANQAARRLAGSPDYAFVTVTGPHTQNVPG
jgi:hypothetical protein